MKAEVDKDTCIGCELCAGMCPDVYHMDNDGKSEAIEGDVPQSLEESAKEAAESCPVFAITVE